MVRILPEITVAIGIVVLLGLGTWQMQRLAWKEALIAERDAGMAQPPIALPDNLADGLDVDFRPVTVTGIFRHDLEQLYGTRARSNVLGHHLLTPLIRENGQAILIDRGWVPADQAHPAARPAGQLEGMQTISGIARSRGDDRQGFFTPDNDSGDRRWYHYDLEAMSAAVGLDLLPIVVEADTTPNPGGLPIGGRTETALANNHLHYALTWYGLAVALIGVYTLFRRQQRLEQAKPTS